VGARVPEGLLARLRLRGREASWGSVVVDLRRALEPLVERASGYAQLLGSSRDAASLGRQYPLDVTLLELGEGHLEFGGGCAVRSHRGFEREILRREFIVFAQMRARSRTLRSSRMLPGQG